MRNGRDAATYRIGFDIGGTFTDFVITDEATGRTESHKVLTTPREPARAVLEGVRALVGRLGASAADLRVAIHGTTLITNALIERRGASLALVTTAGFRDVLEMGREMRYDIYDLHMAKPEPLVDRPWRLEVVERLDKDGQVLVPLDRASLEAAIGRLASDGIEAVAVTLLHSFRNAAHEEQVRAAIAEALPHLSISISSEVSPEIREYERMSTTVGNAYVQPVAERYLANIQRNLGDEGYGGRLFLMLSSGGIGSAETAMRFPIRLLESGPAAGALASVFLGERIGRRNIISFDMGGTTAKTCVIKNGQPTKTNVFEIARVHRFKKGSGIPVRIPSIEMIEIGAGGGSIARVDELGLLKVGPQSAGADPGPACYGFGGREATVTDANVVLGYIDPDYFLGGRMQLDRRAAEAAIERLGASLGLDLLQTASGIFQVVNENMISATRVHVAERGEDPRRFSLMAFGGAGPVHAWAIARALKMPELVCPPGAGVTSSLGFLVAPVSFDLARSYVVRLNEARLADVAAAFADMEREGAALVQQAGADLADTAFRRSADMRHAGQGHEVNVPLPEGDVAALSVDELKRIFYERYRALYGHAHESVDVEVLTLRLVASGPAPRVELERVPRNPGSVAAAFKGTRRAYFAELGGLVETRVYDRYALQAGATIEGPAIVEEADSTAVIGPDMAATVDEHRNLLVRLNGRTA